MSSATLLHRLRTALAPRYAVDAELAAGGMGIVFAGRDNHLGRPVAIKVLQPGMASAKAVERFTREARTLARLRHPNVLSVHDADEADGLHFFVMDLFEGPTLAERLGSGRLTPAELRRLARGLLEGLAAAHDLGIIHRDIKPSNIFFHDGHVAIADFGIASSTQITPDEHLTEPGHRIGTPKYMPPEQLVGLRATPQTDIYAAGLVLYEAATGQAWPAPLDPRSADWRRVPLLFRRPLRTALATDPTRRWQDARRFAHALAPPRRRSLLAFGALVPILLGLIAWLIWPSAAAPAGTRADLAVVPFTGPDTAVAGELTRFTAANLGWSPRWLFRPLADVRAGGPNAHAWADGSLHAEGDSQTIVLTIYDSAGPAKRTRVPGHPARIVEWAHAVADTVVAATFPHRAAEFRDLMAASRGDFTANKLLIAGIDAFAADDWPRADSLLRRAIDRDPSLVQAVWELDLMQKWRREEPSEADRERLRGVTDSLREPYASLVRLELEPNLLRRLAGYATLVDSYPRNSRARFLYINEAFHRGALSGMALDSALRLMRDGIARDPYLDQVTMYDLMVWGYLHIGDRLMADSALAERAALLRRLGSEDEFGGLLRLVYDSRFRPLWGGVKARGAALKYARKPDDLLNYLRLGLSFDVPELQVRLGGAVSRATAPAARATGHMARALALFELGRSREGAVHLDSATRLLDSPEADLHAHMWSVIPPALGYPITEPVRVARALSALDSIAGTENELAPQALWALAIAAYGRGDTASGAAAERRLGHVPVGPGPAYLGAILAAIGAAARGQIDSAVALTDTLFTDERNGTLGGPFARAALHLERGRWLRALGRGRDAEASWLFHENSYLRGWPRRETQSGEVDAVLSGLARLLRGELAIEEGRVEAGCRLLERVRGLWADADPSLDSLAERAARAAEACP